MMRLVRRSSRRYLTRHPWQIALTVLGIALGVAVVVAVDLAQASARRAFELSTQGVVGKATHEITGGADGLNERLYARLRMNLSDLTAAPVVEGYATLRGHHETFRVLGVDPFAEAAFRGYLDRTGRRRIDLRRFLTEPGAVLMNAATAARLGLQPGASLTLRVGSAERKAHLLGLIPDTGATPRRALDDLLLTDIATAQELLDMQGRLSRIDLIVPSGGQGKQQIQAIRALLPEGAWLGTTGRRMHSVEQMTRAFNTNLTALSLLALLVGMFLIYNTMTFLVVQRRELIGALRALGVMRTEIAMTVLGEALLIGLVATTLGLALGIVLAKGLVHLVTQTINDLYFVVSVRELTVPWLVLAKGLVLGVGATAVAALAPAREAAGVAPRTAMARSQIESRFARLAPRAAAAGGLSIAFGLGVLGISGHSMAFGFLGLFAIVIGCALLTPAVTAVMMHTGGRVLGRIFGLLGRLMCRAVTATLSRTAVAIGALMVAVATTVGIGLMIHSFRDSVAEWLEHLLRADLYISVPGPATQSPASTIDPALMARLSRLPGVKAVGSVRRLTVDGTAGRTELAVYQLPGPGYAGFQLKAGGNLDALWPAFQKGGAVLVSEPYAYRHRLRIGSEVQLPTDRGQHAFRVAGIYYDYGSDQGVVAMSRTTYSRYWRDHRLTGIGIYADHAADIDRLRSTIRRLAGSVGSNLIIKSNKAIRESSLAVFDRTFAITQVLRMLSAAIAFIGVFSALMALQLERSRELGVLRAIGFTPRQLWALTLGETGLMGVAAGALALPVGTVLALLLVHVINRRSFGWTMQMHISPDLLLQGFGLAVLAALLAGLYPSWRMARTAPAEALRTE